MAQTDLKISKYNSAVSELTRIDFLFQAGNNWKAIGKFDKWNQILDTVWMELAADAEKKHYKEYDEFTKLIIRNFSNKHFLHQLLIKKQIFLKKLQNAQGKGTAYYEDDDGL